MPEGYKHLTYEQRCQISALLKSNILKKDIAIIVGISESRLRREVRNNSNKDGSYTAKKAHFRAKKRKRVNALNPRRIVDKIESYIKEKLALKWSPKQLAGRLKLDYNKSISCSGVYEYISKDRRNGGKLYLSLRRKGRKRRDYNPKKAGKSLIPNRVDIAERPPIVDAKSRIGDWEADTIVGRGKKSGLITLVERFSKHLIIIKIDNFKAHHVACKISSAISKIKHKVFTMTFDNGLEFANHTTLKETFPLLQTYFAKPFKSWQRGLNEHTNGLIREYFPKGTDFSSVSQLQLTKVQNALNFRPREVLNFKTPEEVFFRPYAKS